MRCKKCVVLCFIMLLIGCLGSVATAKTKITVSFWGDVWQSNLWQKVIDDFHAVQDEIEVEPLHIPSGYKQKVLTMIAAGTAPDVMAWEDKYGLEFAAIGAFKDLNPLIEQDAVFRLDDLYHVAVEDLNFKGVQWALPWSMLTNAFVYNPELFDYAGVQYPPTRWDDESWNWDSLVDTAKKLTRDLTGDGSVDQWGFHFHYTWSRWRIYVWQSGGEVWDDKAQNLLLDQESSLQGLRYIYNLVNVHGVSPRYGVFTNAAGGFLEKKTAMTMYASTPRDLFNWTVSWDVGAYARGPAGNATVVVPDGVAISKTTAHTEAAWEFVKFLVGEGGQRTMAQRGISPNRRTTRLFIEPSRKENLHVYLDAMAMGRVVNYTTKWTDLEGVMQREVIVPMLQGVRSPEEGVSVAMPLLRMLLQEAESRI
ncbi:MAG TPA: sugar ABC transporter substrate-binding protein [Firmicutes bacterium]|nr:sugar ABC transporter substrate-binding protein [Bacillota bacterium]